MAKKRVNKSKKDIVSNIQLVQDAERRRALVRDILFPYLVEMNDSIMYTKVFLQAFSSLVSGVYDDRAKRTTIGELTPDLTQKLESLFRQRDPKEKQEYNRYMELINRLGDISVQDIAYAMELPRFIDGFLLKDKSKESIKNIPIDEILG